MGYVTTPFRLHMCQDEEDIIILHQQGEYAPRLQ